MNQILKSEILILDSKAFSINSMYCKNRNYTTTDYKSWAQLILSLLKQKPNSPRLASLESFFDFNQHRYSITITTYFPSNILITKDGYMSSKAFDVSNIEKPLIDLIFLPKYHLDTPNLNIDDKFISDLSSRKRISSTGNHYIEVKLDILSLQDIASEE